MEGEPVGSSQGSAQLMASQISDLRMKLEEKRRRIEAEKCKMEMALAQQKQRLGKQAFLQAVSKVSWFCVALDTGLLVITHVSQGLYFHFTYNFSCEVVGHNRANLAC